MMRSKRFAARLLALAGLVGALAACEDDGTGSRFDPKGRRVFAVDAQGNLLTFGSENPQTVRSVAVTGLQGNESLSGIDFRPVDGGLYAVGTSSRIYRVDTLSAVATAVGTTAFNPALASGTLGFDFNPTVDRIRVHAVTGQNLRLNPVTGATAAVDTALTYTDAPAGTQPQITGTAYTNSVAGATTTVLFGIDSNRDVLTLVNAPNGGRMTTVGPLGVNTSEDVGFDIVGPDAAREVYASLTVGGRSELYTINLTTGAATRVARIGGPAAVRGIAVAP